MTVAAIARASTKISVVIRRSNLIFVPLYFILSVRSDRVTLPATTASPTDATAGKTATTADGGATGGGNPHTGS